MKLRNIILMTLLSWSFTLLAQEIKKQDLQLRSLTNEVKSSFRGLSVVNNKVIWVSGSNGYIGKSIDAGKSWVWIKPKGYENLDFRDIIAFSENKVIAMAIASPAYILMTEDSGTTWKEVYKNTDEKIFLDGMDFWDSKKGLVFGDPINHKMQLLKTLDGGFTWQDISDSLQFELKEGEAGFAASGTSIKTLGNGKVWIVTGGTAASVYFSDNFGDTWHKFASPMKQGIASQGAFSIDFKNENEGIMVGGDYKDDTNNENVIFLTNDGGKSWYKPQKSTFGFRSTVKYLTNNICIATGTSGTDISYDAGNTWQNISKEGFHNIDFHQKKWILSGPSGKVFQVLKN